ncbi:MAG: DUF4372 domain-containing protein [Desulfobacterales bacterium]|nr:DUF4372 domain-containing protein [Desulfobacterales bacterium]
MSQKFNLWKHFVAMPFCQRARAKRLRKICCGLACCPANLKRIGMKTTPNESSLSYANAHRPFLIDFSHLDRCDDRRRSLPRIFWRIIRDNRFIW